MESILAIGVGLVLRVVVDVLTDNDDRVGGVLVGLWEGVALSHFVRRMPRSFDPYLGFGFRIFVDFLFTQSLSRLALVSLWALVGMLLADIAPNLWRDSGLRHLYRQVRKDVRHVKRAVPRIRIKNDLPSVRLFNRPRSTSPETSASIRSDRATPSRSTAPSPAPAPGPARRPGRSPPGTFPDVSGWSETGTNVSSVRERTIPSPGPSPALIPSREHAVYEQTDTVRVATSQTHATIVESTTVAITLARNESVVLGAAVDTAATLTSLERIDDPLHLDPPAIPDDWVDINRPSLPQVNEPATPVQLGDSTPVANPGPLTTSPSRPASVVAPPPPIDVLPDIPNLDHADRLSQLPDQVPLPESRAASVIGGVFDQPQPRSALHDSLRSRVDKATSVIGIDHGKSLAQPITKQSMKKRSWGEFLSLSRPSVDAGSAAPEPPPKETTSEKRVEQGKPGAGSAAQGPGPEPQIPTPAQVDPPANILTQSRDATPLLLAQVVPEPDKRPEPTGTSRPDLAPTSAGVDDSPAPLGGRAHGGDAAGPSKAGLVGLFDLPSPTRSPPPPFTEFAGVPEDAAAGEAAAEEDPMARPDDAPTELTEAEKAAEKKRVAFLLAQVKELETSVGDLGGKLDKEDDPANSPARAIESDLLDAQRTLKEVKARIERKKFSDAPSNPPTKEVSLSNMTTTEVQFAATSAILGELLARDDAGPMTIQFSLPTNAKTKPAKKKIAEAKDALVALAKRHQFSTRSESATNTVTMTF